MPVDPRQAQWFIRQLPHTKGRWAGQPFGVLPWQDDLINRLFRLDPRMQRIVRRAYVQTARKSGKSEIGAALALTLLVCDGEPGGEVIGAAAKRDQARLILDTAKRMVRYGKIGGVPLSTFLDVRRDGIYFPELDSVYRIVSADGEKEHGLNPHAIIFDELHSLGKQRDIWDALETSQGARENPLMVSFTTPGPIPVGIAYEEYKHARAIEQGHINDPEFLGIVYEADKELAIDDERGWMQANPSYPVTPGKQWIAARARAVLSGQRPEYVFRRLQLSQWTTALERWLPRKKYEACGLPPIIPDGAEVVIGVDAALKRDTYGVALAYKGREFVEREDGLTVPIDVAHIKVRAFTPEREGEYIDQTEVLTYILGLCARYRVTKIMYDPAYMTLMAQQLQDHGANVEPYPQSPERMSEATETFQRLVLDLRLRHGNDRTFDEQVANLGIVATDRGVRISKRKSGGQIDAVSAAVMCLQELFGMEDPDAGEEFAELT